MSDLLCVLSVRPARRHSEKLTPEQLGPGLGAKLLHSQPHLIQRSCSLSLPESQSSVCVGSGV